MEEGYDLKCKVPRFFSETRFANFSAKVCNRFRYNTENINIKDKSHYFDFRESYPFMIAFLEEVKELYSNGRSDEKKKAQTADVILKSIYNIKFSLNLAVLCDVYNIYSQIAVLLQKVSTLPHIRYDQFKELLEDYKEML